MTQKVNQPTRPLFRIVGDNREIVSTTDTFFQPTIEVTRTNTDYSAAITYDLAGIGPHTLNNKNQQALFKLTPAQVTALFKKSGMNTYLEIKASIAYSRGGVTSPHKDNVSIKVPISNRMLKPYQDKEPVLSYTSAGSVKLDALLSYGLNRVIIKTPALDGLEGSEITDIVYEFNREIKRGSFLPDGSNEVSFGPYASSVLNNRLRITTTDTRGLSVTIDTFSVHTRDYRLPSITVTDVHRIGGFSDKIAAKRIVIDYFNPMDSGINNEITEVKMDYFERGATNPINYGPFFDLDTIFNNTFEVSDFPILNPANANLFRIEQSFRVTFSVKDRLSDLVDMSLKNQNPEVHLLSTGKPLMFMDEVNTEIGIGTTDPQGTFHVSGDSFAESQFSLNGLFYDEGDTEEYELK